MAGLRDYLATGPGLNSFSSLYDGVEMAIWLRGWRIGTVVLWEWGVPR